MAADRVVLATRNEETLVAVRYADQRATQTHQRFERARCEAVIVERETERCRDVARGAAFDTLHEQRAVIGPAIDGGYYLIGLRADAWPAAAVLFSDMAWSTSTVLEQTLQRAAEAGIAVHSVPQWYDIDTIDDLRVAADDVLPDSRLYACLKDLPL